MLLPLIFTLFFIAVSVPVVALPLRRDQEGNSLSGDGPASPAPSTYETALLALRDLEFDHQLGVVADEDYDILHAQLLAQAAAALEKSEREADEDVAARIEAAVRERRTVRQPAAQQHRATPARFCPQCGNAVDAGDHFCTNCGTSLK